MILPISSIGVGMSISENKPRYRKRRFIAVSVILIAAVGVLSAAYAFLVEPNRFAVNHYPVTVSKLNPSFEGLKIIAISDIHGGSSFIDQAKIEDVVDAANSENADLIVLLGDYVSQTATRGSEDNRRWPIKMPMDVISKILGKLKAKHGVFAVIGNHDDWYGGKDIKESLERVGITVLVDEVKSIDIKGQSLNLLGVRDYMGIDSEAQFTVDMRQLLEGVRGDVFVLSHNPDVADLISGERSVSPNLRLLLAGHTHGGQVRLPVIGSPIVPSSFGQTFAVGHVKYKGLDVFVTTGVGTSILPVRFGVPPEISVVMLRSN